ncbi:protein of unknown function [Rhodovastum atsumiense]|nr:protein of unknown function [Rhodovastum atsumiense]
MSGERVWVRSITLIRPASRSAANAARLLISDVPLRFRCGLETGGACPLQHFHGIRLCRESPLRMLQMAEADGKREWRRVVSPAR